MTKLLLRPNFLVSCEEWRDRIIPSNLLGDIYDRHVWKVFANFNGRQFLSEPHSLAFSLNVDWFQPFKHATDSVGAIYRSILNLPRSLQYRPENIILCGIIPGHKEPKDLNVHLQLLIQELLLIWEGSMLDIPPYGPIQISCSTSDLPATRKVCGFASHSASFGCSKCLKKFTTLGDKLDYSGFNREGWKLRDLESHKVISKSYREANTKSKQDDIVKNYGVRYSVLSQLPYFNVV